MTLFKSPRRAIFVSLTTLIGLLFILGGVTLAFWKNEQIEHYNRGMAAYHTLEFEQAVNEFNLSNQAFNRYHERDWLERFIYPAPDRELASLAAGQKGNSLVMLKRTEEAVEAYKDALRLNPGTDYRGVEDFPDLSPTDITRLKREARLVKYNMELLFRNNANLQQKKGEGNKKEAKEEEEKEQIPQLAPGGQPGKGEKDDI
ncbi:MAG: tetratricopeptide repeat protein [Cyanobacteria bacterium HKST-UBA02]|nr:tetratricopeptide repeat protein [Cyanobacteria bacterium HKST-UBA02]